MLESVTGQRRTRPIRAIVSWAILLISLLTHGGARAEEAFRARLKIRPSSHRTCGAETLFFCLSLSSFVQNATLVELEKGLPVGFEGVSMSELIGAGERLSVPIRSVRTTLRDLDGLGVPAVLHVNGNHFIAFVRFEQDRVLLFDNRFGLFDCTPEWFDKHYTWRGDCLLIGEPRGRMQVMMHTGTLAFLSVGTLLFSWGLVFLLDAGPLNLVCNTTVDSGGAAKK
jgi:hypothetical protein